MSDKSQEILLGGLVEPPEFDADDLELEERYIEAFFESSKMDIHDQMNTEDFKNTWLVLRSDILNRDIEHQRIFAEQTIDKISEIYDYRFPINISLDTQPELDIFYKFLEFLEYDNIDFISFIWKFLNQQNLLTINIMKFCNDNTQKIIKEIDEQLEMHSQNELITLFLKSSQRETLINWFITHSERNKVGITINILG